MKNQKPYYAAIFTSTQTETIKGYPEIAEHIINVDAHGNELKHKITISE